MSRYQEAADSLRKHYDATASRRDESERAAWKLETRQRFLTLLQTEGKRTVLEIGAGPGHDSLYFKQNGLDVLATDLAPAMIELCRRKGLNAMAADFLALKLADDTFDAVYALNCLLHVPRASLPAVLENIRRMLRMDGLFNVITYGGMDREGSFVEGGFAEERFLSYYSQESLLHMYCGPFELVDLKVIDTGESERPTAYSLILRK